MDAPSSAPVAGRTTEMDVLQPLLEIRGWMRFLAWLAIAAGALQCLSIVGVLWGWIPIWIGVLLLRSVERLERGQTAGDANDLRAGVQSLATAIQVKAVLALIGLLVTALVFVGMIVFAVALALGHSW